YFQTTALYPIVDMIERHLGFVAETPAEDKLRRIEESVSRSSRPATETVPLLAALLSVPLSEAYRLPDLPPQKQRQATFELLATWIGERLPALFVVEDLHWADPSTLEFLGLLIQRDPQSGLFMLFTYRPE